MNTQAHGHRPEDSTRDSRIRTFTGRLVDPFNLKSEDINIEDIAHALSNVCRFTGHVRKFYSVAQHCVLVSKLCTREIDEKYGLIHDASEAYICDIASPVKYRPEMDQYRAIERIIERNIYGAFGLHPERPESVKVADYRAYQMERQALMTGVEFLPTIPPITDCWTPEEAEDRFLHRFIRLFPGRYLIESRSLRHRDQRPPEGSNQGPLSRPQGHRHEPGDVICKSEGAYTD